MQTTRSPQNPIMESDRKTHEACAYELMEMLPRVGTFIGNAMRRQANLSMPQLKVLFFISRHPGTSLSQAADHLAVTNASASDLVSRLVKRGYVLRADDPEERRKVLLSLTESGQTSLKEAQRFAQAALKDKLGGMEDADLIQIISGLQPLKKVFTEV
jgi:DNA-binding MarR family transcriptional regulator